MCPFLFSFFFGFWHFTPDFFHFIHCGYHHGLGGGKVIAIHCGWVYEGLNYGPYLTIEEQIALKPTEERRVQYRRTSSFDCYIKKKFRAKINFHSHNSILSWAKIATQKKSKRLKKKKRKTFFSHCKPAEFAGICDPAWWLVGWKWPLTFSKVDSNESFHFVLIT